MNDTHANRTYLQTLTRKFGCDQTRIVKACGKLFLVLGWKRNTKQDAGQWYKNGRPIDFDYIKEMCVASGSIMAELKKSALEYEKVKRKSKVTRL